MLIGDVRIDCPSGETIGRIVTPPCHAMMLIQLVPTDCDRVAMRFRSSPPSAPQGWVQLRAGELIPMPFNASVIGTLGSKPAAPQDLEVCPLYEQDDPLLGLDVQRAVFCFIERADLSDAPRIGGFGFQRWLLPGKDPLPINLPADFLTKQWAYIPCRGFRSGQISLAPSATGANSSWVSVAAYADGSLIGSPLPLIVIPHGPNGTYPLQRAFASFWIPDGADYLILTAWRGTDANATVLPTGSWISLNRKREGGPELTSGVSFAHDCVLGATMLGPSASSSPQARSRYGIARGIAWNDSGAGNITCTIGTYALDGLSCERPAASLSALTASAAIAPGVRGAWAATAGAYDAACVWTTPTGPNQLSRGMVSICS
jgi:hypothetical protein